MALIRAHHINLGQRLVDVSLSLAPGEMLGIIGPNGAGKSSLLQCLAGLLACQGEVHLAGHALGDMPAMPLLSLSVGCAVFLISATKPDA